MSARCRSRMTAMRKVLFALVLVACNKGDTGPTCSQVVDHMLDVMKQTMGSDRVGMVKDCEDRKLGREARSCYMAAKSLGDLAACQKLVAPAGSAGSAH